MNMNLEFLDHIFLRNSIKSWLLAAVTALVLCALFQFIKWFLAHRFFGDNRIKTLMAARAASVLTHSTRASFLILVGVYFSFWHLDFSDRTRLRLDHVAIFVLLIQFWKWGSLLVDFWLEEYLNRAHTEDGAKRTTLKAMAVVARILVFVTLVIWALDSIGINVTPLIAGLGVGGIAITLALQSILGDIFASITIVLDKPFVIGDLIQVDTFKGTIESIGIKTTRLRSETGEQLVFPNNNLLQSRIRNLKRMRERRTAITLSIKYNTPPNRLKKIADICKNAVQREPAMRFERVNLVKLGDSSLLYDLVYWYRITVPDQSTDISERILIEIVEGFHAEQIDFGMPSREVIITRDAHPGTA